MQKLPLPDMNSADQFVINLAAYHILHYNAGGSYRPISFCSIIHYYCLLTINSEMVYICIWRKTLVSELMSVLLKLNRLLKIFIP